MAVLECSTCVYVLVHMYVRQWSVLDLVFNQDPSFWGIRSSLIG